MPGAPFPIDEASRLARLRALGLLDSGEEPAFEALVRAASVACGMPIALISLIDADRQWFLANQGLDGTAQTPREQAFCAHAILRPTVLEVEDARLDERFSDNPLVLESPGIRAYAGVPLRPDGGPPIGTLCVIDRVPRRLSAHQREMLEALAAVATQLIEGRARYRERIGLLDTERERLARVAKATSNAVIITDAEGRTTWVNEGFTRITGYEPAEILGRKPGTLLQTPDTDPAAVQTIREALRAQRGCRVELLNAHKDGRRYWLDLEIQPLFEADGTLSGFMAIETDITERRAKDRAIQERDTLMNRAGEIAGVGTWVLDSDRGALTWSAETYRIHGLAPDETPSVESAIEFYAPEARPVIRAAVERAMLDGTPWDLELPFVRRDGAPLWVRTSGTAEFIDGRAVRLLGAFQDITQRIAQQRDIEAAHQRMALASDSARVGFWEVDIEKGEATWDEWTFRLHDLSPGTGPVRYDDWARKVHRDDLPRVEAAWRGGLRSRDAVDVEFRIVRDDGGVRHLRATFRVLRDDRGRAYRLVGVNWDVTRERELASHLEAEHELLQVTMASIADAVVTTDARGRVTWMNPVAERMTGWLLEDAAVRPVVQIVCLSSDGEAPAPLDPVLDCLQRAKVVAGSGDVLLRSAADAEFGIEYTVSPIRDAVGELQGAVMVFRDVTEQRRLSGEMRYRATHDALTGLVNRGEFEARLRRLLDQAHADHSVHALMYIDLDRFKIVNDACGHAAGDQLLRQVAGLLGETVRQRDTLARLGGDEFAVLLERCTPAQAQRVAQKICERMEDFRFVHDGQRFRIGASIGLVPVDSRFGGVQAILKAADGACYAAKEAGRNRVHAWEDSDEAILARQGEMQWATRLEEAIDANAFVLFGQRVVPISGASDRIDVEVLLRLPTADGTLLSPGTFLPAAERFQLASRLDRWVLSEVLRWFSRPQALDGIGWVAVNLSGQSVGDRAFHRAAIDLLTSAGPELCRHLCVEITETAAITHLGDAAHFMGQLRALGVRVALDDFGAGASSFGYLKSLPVDLLKIDGQFVRDLLSDALDAAAVRSFVDVARVVGVPTVAEFVENGATLEALRWIGVDHAQGYGLHRPEPLAAAIAARIPPRLTDLGQHRPKGGRAGSL